MPMDFLNLVIQQANVTGAMAERGFCLNIRHAVAIGCLSVYIIVLAASG